MGYLLWVLAVAVVLGAALFAWSHLKRSRMPGQQYIWSDAFYALLHSPRSLQELCKHFKEKPRYKDLSQKSIREGIEAMLSTKVAKGIVRSEVVGGTRLYSLVSKDTRVTQVT